MYTHLAEDRDGLHVGVLVQERGRAHEDGRRRLVGGEGVLVRGPVLRRRCGISHRRFIMSVIVYIVV